MINSFLLEPYRGFFFIYQMNPNRQDIKIPLGIRSQTVFMNCFHWALGVLFRLGMARLNGSRDRKITVE